MQNTICLIFPMKKDSSVLEAHSRLEGHGLQLSLPILYIIRIHNAMLREGASCLCCLESLTPSFALELLYVYKDLSTVSLFESPSSKGCLTQKASNMLISWTMMIVIGSTQRTRMI